MGEAPDFARFGRHPRAPLGRMQPEPWSDPAKCAKCSVCTRAFCCGRAPLRAPLGKREGLAFARARPRGEARLDRCERSAGAVRVDGALHDLAGAARVGRRSRHVLAALDAKLSGVGRSVGVAERASGREIIRCEAAFVVAGGGCALLAGSREREGGCRRDEQETTAGDGVRGWRTLAHDDAQPTRTPSKWRPRANSGPQGSRTRTAYFTRPKTGWLFSMARSTTPSPDCSASAT
jgi:hypothetical protein